jgi:hypothetical protein
MIVGLAFGMIFTVLANILYELSTLRILFLIAISTIIATLISIVYQVVKALYEIFKERKCKNMKN